MIAHFLREEATLEFERLFSRLGIRRVSYRGMRISGEQLNEEEHSHVQPDFKLRMQIPKSVSSIDPAIMHKATSTSEAMYVPRTIISNVEYDPGAF